MTDQQTSQPKGDILVVDDTLTNLRLLSQTLSIEGYRIQSARSGSLALSIAQSAVPDLILLDVMMPDMDGYEVCRRLKADPQTRDIPVIFISAKDDKDARLKGFHFGGVDYITKPFFHEEVLARVNLHLTMRKLQNQLLRRNHELDLLRKLAETFNQMQERDQVTRMGLRHILDLLKARCGWLILLNPAGSPQLEAYYGLEQAEVERISDNLRSITQAVSSSDDLSRTLNLSSLGCFDAQESASVSWIHLPLVMGNQTTGILNLALAKNPLEDEDFRLLNTIASQFSQTIERVLLFDEVQQLAKTDSLTGLFNRRFFLEIAQREVEKSRRYQHPLSILMIDIDHFKQINDSLGHSAGDEALRQMANTCRDNLRQVDLICRYGGEEFLCLLPETSLANAAQTAERLRRCVESLTILTHQHEVRLTISIGVTSNFQPDLSLQEMIDQADAAMYAAKQAGRNLVRIYHP